MKTYDYDYVIYIGRFEGPHNGHMTTLTKALRLGQKVIVLLGTANSPRTFKNPWTETEREFMMRNSMSVADNARVEFAGVEDRLYQHPEWLVKVRHAVELIMLNTRDQLVPEVDIEDIKFAIIGHDKDESSVYIRDFPEWTVVDVGSHTNGPNSKPLSSTMIRHLIFTGNMGYIEGNVPSAVYSFMENFVETEEFKLIKAEYDHYVEEENTYKELPYWMNFKTADAVVFQSGHVLLVKRGRIPGKGLWALPGGHVEPTETAYEAAFRELDQETKIKVPLGKLQGSVVFEEEFNHPDRSLRCRVTGIYGRTSTTAFCIALDATATSGKVTKLPKVKGRDDAVEARWFPVSDINSMRNMMFEDHADIITEFHSKLPKGHKSTW